MAKYDDGKVKPCIDVVDEGKPVLFTGEDKTKIKIDITKVEKMLGLKFKDPAESIEKIVKNRIKSLVLSK